MAIGDVWPLLSAEQMRCLDRHTIETLGVPGELLMECAGRVVTAEVLSELPTGSTVWVVCGSGNNGGDGLVVARHLHLLGTPVRVVWVGDPKRLRGDPAANWKRAQAVGVPVAQNRWRPDPGDVLVDAIFGTGLDRPVEGAAATAIRKLCASRPACKVVAVDLPSGLDADTGQVLGCAVEADVTVTLALPKLGLALEPGRSLAGRVVVGRIGIADEAPQVGRTAELWTRRAAAARLPERPAAGHKGSFGHLLVVAGSEGKTGAAALSAEGAARVGAGLVTIACPESTNAVLEVKCTEAMTAPVPETAAHGFAADAEKPILDLAEGRDAVAAGPGIGRGDETLALMRRLAEKLERPLVLDADGLLAFTDAGALLAARSAPTVLTPHPGEAAALLGSSPAEINCDRTAAARRLAEETGAVVVLKGAATVTAEPGGRCAVNASGGPILATGGTGDVLTGLIGGLLAQGLDAFDAGALGAFLHGRAADRLGELFGTAGVLAGDLAEEIPATLQSLRESLEETGGRAVLGGSDGVAFPEPR
jgi:NAD(P)H-hydrate epimerase